MTIGGALTSLEWIRAGRNIYWMIRHMQGLYAVPIFQNNINFRNENKWNSDKQNNNSNYQGRSQPLTPGWAR